MSSLARVFVILNLVLAVGFLFAAATFLAATDNYKTQLLEVTESSTNRIAEVTAEKDAALSRAADSDTKASDAETARAKAQSDFSGQEDETTRVQGLLEAANKTIEELTKRANTDASSLQTSQTKIDNANSMRETAEEGQRKAEADKMTAEERAEQLRQELAAAQRVIGDNEVAIASLREQNDALEAFKAKAVETGVSFLETEIVKPYTASVVKYDPQLNLVMINVGANDGVKRKSMVSIVRQGTYIGEVRIDTVTENAAGGSLTIPNGNLRPRVGDTATNTLN